jgi:putative ABC transport system permease protein
LHNPAVQLLQAWRTWRGGVGVGLLAAAALAAGIGSATAIYSIVNAVMLKPLPYPDSDRFVAILGGATNDPSHDSSLTFDDAQAYHDRTQAFDLFGWFRDSGQNVTFEGEPHHVEGVRITAPFVHGLGVNPTLGQWFRSETEVVISNAFWRRLGSDTAIVGKPITMDGRSYTIAGVMPPAFRLPVAGLRSAGERTDVWLQLERENVGAFYFAYARRKPGVTFPAAEADAKRVAAEIAAANPAGREAYTAHVYDLRETVVKQIRPTLLLLFAAAALLFLITCANAAGLLLARSVARARETAMRVALGASRGQLASQYFLECLPVALAGALGGLILSATLTPVIVRMAADYIPRAEDVAIDWTVLLFAIAAAFVATVIASLAPLWQAVKTAPADVLGEGARGSAGTRSRRASQSIVVAEIALAFVLLTSSGMLLLHLRNLSRTAAGFDTRDLLTFVVSAPAATVAEGRTAFQARVIEALARVPGVDEVGFANQLPLDGCCLTANIYPDGRPVDTSEAQRTALVAASSGFVKALRIPLRSGRLLNENELPKDLIFVMVNEAAVRVYWNGQDPIGRFGTFMRPGGSRFQVIGVVGDIRNDGLAKPTIPEVYISSRIPQIESMHMAVRSSLDLPALVPEIRKAVRAIDPEQPVHSIATMDDIVQRSLTLERAASFLTGFFAAVALLIATLGVYGVVAYLVRQRTVEIGTRMAIGASRRDVVTLVMRDGVKMAVVGVLLGAVAAVVAVTYLGRALQIAGTGATPFIYSIIVIGAVTLLASSLPAWRASLLSPMVAIRDQPGSMWEAARSRVRRTLQSLSDDHESAAERLGGLIPEFAGAVHGAESAHDSVRAAVIRLQERAGAESAILLERRGDTELAAGACAIPAEGFLHNRLRYYRRALALAPADFGSWLRWAREFKPRYASEIETLEATQARLAVPLRTKDELAGILLLGAPGGRAGYSAAEREALSAAADVLALMLENARLTDRELEQERVRRDLALAAEVQKRLLPSRAPEHGGVSIAGYSIPARVVGGDYFDFLERADGQIGIAIADVAGKGIAAALLMSVVQASLRVISADTTLPVAAIAERMNGFLHRSSGANKYATFFYAQLDPGGRTLRYVNAGHNPPYLVRRSGDGVNITALTAGGTVLGLFPDMPFEDAVVSLHPGDVLVAFTDGVTEALNAQGEEFGEDRLMAVLAAATASTADQLAGVLTNALRQWIGAAEQYDDLTFVVVAVDQPATGTRPEYATALDRPVTTG